MKMVFILESQRRVLEIQLKSTAGGGGFSGIAVTVFAIATNKVRNLIDISVSDL